MMIGLISIAGVEKIVKVMGGLPGPQFLASGFTFSYGNNGKLVIVDLGGNGDTSIRLLEECFFSSFLLSPNSKTRSVETEAFPL